jgi:uncharacterized protein (TIGR02996 family)
MPIADAFLSEICDSPEDDAPRLVFADWLEENGEPQRAEFIRLQVRLAKMGEWEPERAELLDREWELLAVYKPRWWGGTDSALGQDRYHASFLRGFLAHVALSADVLLQGGERIFREDPI